MKDNEKKKKKKKKDKKEEEESDYPNSWLIMTIFKTFKWILLESAFFKLLQDLLAFISPQLLKSVKHETHISLAQHYIYWISAVNLSGWFATCLFVCFSVFIVCFVLTSSFLFCLPWSTKPGSVKLLWVTLNKAAFTVYCCPTCPSTMIAIINSGSMLPVWHNVMPFFSAGYTTSV